MNCDHDGPDLAGVGSGHIAQNRADRRRRDPVAEAA